MSGAALHPEPKPRLDGAKAELHRLLVGLIKLALVNEGQDAAAWRTDALAAQRHVAAASDVAAVHLDDVWALAVKTAESDPVVRRDETVNPMLPTMSPLGLHALTADAFNLEDAVQTIRDVASFG